MSESVAILSQIFTLYPLAWIALIFVLGLLVGSFLNVVIHRTPIMLERDWKEQAEEILYGTPEPLLTRVVKRERYDLVVPRSACPKCNTRITAAQNVPVISWLLLRGKCASCANPISVRYPLVELLTAIMSAVVAWKFGFHWYTAAALFLTWMLIGMSGIDFDTTLLPDTMTLPLLWVGLLLSIAGPDPGLALPVDMKSSIIGAVVGYLSLWSVAHLYRLVTGKLGMGAGDFKLLAALGAWLGWASVPLIIMLSAFAGSLVGLFLILALGRDHKVPIPFGPYLAAAGWIALLWGDRIIDGYLRFTGYRH